MLGKTVRRNSEPQEWYYRNFHPRSSIDYQYIKKIDDEVLKQSQGKTRRYSLLSLAEIKKADDLNKAVHEIHKIKTHPQPDRWALGIDFSRFGAHNPQALPPFHCTPPYSSLNYRQLRSKGYTTSERKKEFRKTYEASTVSHDHSPVAGYKTHDQLLENQEDDLVAPWEDDYSIMRPVRRSESTVSTKKNLYPTQAPSRLRLAVHPPPKSSMEQLIKKFRREELLKKNIYTDEVRLPPVPLWETLHYEGDRVADRLGVRFKTVAQKRYHAYYSDTVPDLRDNEIKQKKPNPIDIFQSPKF